MKKLSLKKVTISSLSNNQLSNAKGGGKLYGYENTDLCNYTDVAGCTNNGCHWGTLNENCSNQINCTAGPNCDYGIHPQ